MNDHAEQEIAQLDFWKGTVSLEPIGGGITNRNFVATDQGHKYFVRMYYCLCLRWAGMDARL